MPIPVFTGIGHERDSTVLDDVAHRRFDTPSKVVSHITQTIRQNAWEALGYAQEIEKTVRRMLAREADAIEDLRGRVEERSRHCLSTARSGMNHLSRQVRTTAGFRCREAEGAIEAAKTRIIDGTAGVVRNAVAGSEQALDSVRLRSGSALVGWALRTLSLIREIRASSEAKALAAARGVASTFTLTKAGIGSAVRTARIQMDHCVERIIGLGPEATLKRGYAIARDPQGRPVGSAESARQHAALTLQFHDGEVPVENPDHWKEQTR